MRDLDALEQVDELTNKLIISEAFNHAYVGSKFDKYKRNTKAFERWQSRIIRDIKKLLGYKIATIWDSFSKGKSTKL